MKFLGIDIGTGGSRAVIVDDAGNVVSSASFEHQPFDSPCIGWAEQDPDDWWRASTEAIREAITKANIKPDEIKAVSFSGQMHGSVLLDASDKVIRPALLWCDQRTGNECKAITERIGARHLIELVSNPAITGFTLPKLLWVRENEPDNWKRVKTVLLPKDYIRLRLSGDKASDVADSSGTLLFNVRERKWSSEMLESFGIDQELLPQVFESTEATGKVSAEGSAATGLEVGTLVIAGAGDNAAGAIGMGVVEPGILSSTIGTSGVVFVVTPQPTIDIHGRIHSLCHATPDRWHMTGVTLTAGQSLRWFRDNFGCGIDYDQLVSEASNIRPGSDGAIWVPYLMGERTPHLDPQARAAFVGLTATHTRAHLTRAVMEGVAFSLRDSIEIFRELETPIETIRLGGGGARSTLWQQIQADVFGQRVELIEADEGAAFGAAILAGVGFGAWASVDIACREAVKTSKYLEPDPSARGRLERNYEAYKLLYGALHPATTIISEKEFH